ncbi:hypothetical protein ACJJTC_007912 [Scirpophaga incertulas]
MNQVKEKSAVEHKTESRKRSRNEEKMPQILRRSLRPKKHKKCDCHPNTNGSGMDCHTQSIPKHKGKMFEFRSATGEIFKVSEAIRLPSRRSLITKFGKINSHNRLYVAFTEAHTERLESEFRKSTRLEKERLAHLALSLNLTESHIAKWFDARSPR